MMSKTKTTVEKVSSKRHIAFSYWSSFSIDLEKKLITPTDFSSIIDLDEFGTALSLDWYEYTILAVHKINFDSDMFKKNIEKAHTIEHYSNEIAIYRNINERAYCMRVEAEEEVILIELM